jgi:hypothetical protein
LAANDPTFHGFQGNGLAFGFVVSNSTPFTLADISFSANVNGLQNQAVGGIAGTITGVYSLDGSSFSQTEIMTVPEPRASALFGCGLFVAILTKRARKRAVVISKRLQ